MIIEREGHGVVCVYGGGVVEEEISIEFMLMRCLFAIGSGVFVPYAARNGDSFFSRFQNTEYYMTADICMMREAYKI